MQHDPKPRVFVVVEVMAGVATDAHCFARIEDAQTRAEQVRALHDENDDDVQVFETTVQEVS